MLPRLTINLIVYYLPSQGPCAILKVYIMVFLVYGLFGQILKFSRLRSKLEYGPRFILSKVETNCKSIPNTFI